MGARNGESVVLTLRARAKLYEAFALRARAILSTLWCDLYLIPCMMCFLRRGRTLSFRRLRTQCPARDVNLLGQAHQAQQADSAIGRVQFPPAEPVPGRAGEGVVVVVPAFAQGEQGHPPQVRRAVPGRVTAVAPEVGGAVDEPGRVVE